MNPACLMDAMLERVPAHLGVELANVQSHSLVLDQRLESGRRGKLAVMYSVQLDGLAVPLPDGKLRFIADGTKVMAQVMSAKRDDNYGATVLYMIGADNA